MSKKNLFTVMLIVAAVLRPAVQSGAVVTRKKEHAAEPAASARSRPRLSHANAHPPDAPREFPANYFEPTDPDRTKVQTIPFTAEEFIKLVPEKIIKLPGLPPAVKVKRWVNGGYVQSVVTLEKYVAELNQYESFLNQLGYTLRDGKLNKEHPTDATVESDLGVILRLRNKKDAERGRERPVVNEILYDPNPFSIYEPYDPKVRSVRDIRLRLTDEARRGEVLRARRAAILERRLRAIRLDRDREVSSDRGVQFRRRSRLDRFERLRRSAGELRAEARLRPTRTLDVSRLRAGWARRGGYTRALLIGSNLPSGVGRVLRVSSGDLPPCGPQPANDVALNPVCDGDAPCGGKINPGTGASGQTEVATGEPCPGAEKEANDPACLFDGEMKAAGVAPALSTVIDAAGGNGWFGAYFSVVLATKNEQQGHTLALDNWGDATAGVSVFGTEVDLLRARGEAQYQTGANPEYWSEAKAFAVIPGVGEIPIQGQVNKVIKGPGAFFFLGPVPISISSEIDLSLGLDDNPPPMTKPPLDCGPGVGRMKMALAGRAKASLVLRAAIDALVAAAGIEAQLLLADDTVGGYVTTEVEPSTNTVKVTPSVEYHTLHLRGRIFLFVELDLLVYDKKWSVLVFQSGGVPDGDTYAPRTYTFSSKQKGV